MTFKTGNFNTETTKYRGWVIGQFVEPSSPFHISNFEVKWVKVNKGYTKESPAEDREVRTLGILISGKYKIDYPSLDKAVVLDHEGDYVFYQPLLPHRAEALEDTLLLVIRWPSISHEQQSKPV